MMKNSTLDKAKGALVGLAIGDAVGMYLEFKEKGEFEPIDDMKAGGVFNLQLGYWTDDTSMALCLADSLLESKGYDSFDVMRRYSLWYDEGYRSSIGFCFDIGNQVRSVLYDFRVEKTGIISIDKPRTDAAGNGSVMRLAPAVIAAFERQNSEKIMQLASVSARETHYSWLAQAGTVYFAEVIRRAILAEEDSNKLEVIENRFENDPNYPESREYAAAMEQILEMAHNVKGKAEEDLKPTGFIVDSLEVALWGFLNFDDFKSGLLAVVNLGGDADTTGAIYGQIAGAFYGMVKIPQSWREKLHEGEEIAELAEELFEMEECEILKTRFEEDFASELN